MLFNRERGERGKRQYRQLRHFYIFLKSFLLSISTRKILFYIYHKCLSCLFAYSLFPSLSIKKPYIYLLYILYSYVGKENEVSLDK